MKHEVWCNVNEHQRVALELDATVGCVGRRIEVRTGLAGWWHQEQPGDEPRFCVDVASSGNWEPSLRDLQVVEDALSAVGGTPDDLLGLILTAQFEMERGAQAEEDR
ncbi:hypothetical protein [Blastococcus sp. TBT05-19]|uniref:hypothetical protein n=1 Tax=Blastococcus sp. TBT05-19 TaxID=2250581 RepID=UPI0011BEC038|nr:hypothetical protein [Blastococcus sp. TBT05-19]